MATATGRGAAKATILIQKGQKSYKALQYDLAEKYFLQAMDMCICGVAVQKQPRIDNDILSGIEKRNLKGALTKLSTSQRCNKQLHIDALDSLIATYEVQNRLDEALEFSLKMVNLSPREPKCYLRLGKVLRLKNQHTTAYHNYKQGIELVKRKSPNHTLLPKLQAQKDKVLSLAMFDPVTELPIELVSMIFRLLNTKTQCRCLCVSKTWKTVLTGKSLSDLWKSQEYTFTRLREPSSPRFLASFTSNWKYAGQSITELSIDGCAQFLKTCKLERLFRFLHNLKILKLREPIAILSLGALPANAKRPKLKSLYLGRGIHPTAGLLRQLLESSSESLEELSVFNLPYPSNGSTAWFHNWPRLDKLKIIRVECLNAPQIVDMGSNIFESTPNVEEAYVDLLVGDLMSIVDGWPRLQSLFVGRQASSHSPAIFSWIHKISLRELHLELHPESEEMPIIWPHVNSEASASSPDSSFPELEKFSMILSPCPITVYFFESLVRAGLESGTLREIHMDPLPTRDFFKNPRSPTIPGWFRSNSVTYLSFAGFSREELHHSLILDDVVLDIASRFPNLSTIDISHEPFPDTLLGKLIQRGVKTIYCQSGQPMRDLKDWASREFGARIIADRPPHIPAFHPDRRQPVRGAYHPYFDSSMF
ncbi:hypothetical protein F5B19DRAFT_467875 [Rostrohypoxylon terebratum]|nr:hypothetical protein F5B19DRAFT_467875 [Rostrohypoxylon terebratum]